jgi:putative ABC transport system permease protein
MNIMERHREIGGLRSLGMTQVQVIRMVLAEALSHGIMGGIFGLAFGFLFAQAMIMAMNKMIGYDLVYRFTLQPYLIGLAIALFVSQVAAYQPAYNASRINIVSAIKHE